MLKETLKNFYVITKGYHGDLHTGNIEVVYDPKTGEAKRVIVFDYGSHKKFKSKVNSTMCLEDIMDIINREYKKSFNKYKYAQNSKFPESTSVNVYYPNRSQPRRSNTQLLKAITPFGKIFEKFEHQNNKSLYNLASNKPKNIKSFNTSFVSPKSFTYVTGTRPKNLLIRELKKKKHPHVTNNQLEKNFIKLYSKFGNDLYTQNRQYLPGLSKKNYGVMIKNLLNYGRTLYNKRRALIKKREPTVTNNNVKQALRGMNAATLKLTNAEHKMLMNYITSK